MRLLYLTGAPASGKSTITNAISQIEPSIQIIRYSDEIKISIQNLSEDSLQHNNLEWNLQKLFPIVI